MNIYPSLSIREIYNLYEVLKDGLPEKDEPYLLHEIIQLLNGISSEQFNRSLEIMKIKWNSDSSKNSTVSFIKSLKDNNFFMFVEFIDGFMKHGK